MKTDMTLSKDYVIMCVSKTVTKLRFKQFKREKKRMFIQMHEATTIYLLRETKFNAFPL